MAPRARLELATLRLTAECSTIELPGSRGNQKDTSRRLKPSQSSQGTSECQCGEMRDEAKELEAAEEEEAVKAVEEPKIEEEGKKERLLQAVYPRVVADQGLENGQDVAAVLDYPLEHTAQARLALRFAVPFGKNSGRDLDVAAQLFRRVAAQKQPVEKGRLALRKLEVALAIVRGCGNWKHSQRKRSLPKFSTASSGTAAFGAQGSKTGTGRVRLRLGGGRSLSLIPVARRACTFSPRPHGRAIDADAAGVHRQA